MPQEAVGLYFNPTTKVIFHSDEPQTEADIQPLVTEGDVVAAVAAGGIPNVEALATIALMEHASLNAGEAAGEAAAGEAAAGEAAAGEAAAGEAAAGEAAAIPNTTTATTEPAPILPKVMEPDGTFESSTTAKDLAPELPNTVDGAPGVHPSALTANGVTNVAPIVNKSDVVLSADDSTAEHAEGVANEIRSMVTYYGSDIAGEVHKLLAKLFSFVHAGAITAQPAAVPAAVPAVSESVPAAVPVAAVPTSTAAAPDAPTA